MRAALTIAGKDLRQRLRDRSFFMIGILAPFGLALIFSILLAPVTDGTFRPAIGLVDLDQSPTSTAFVSALRALDDEETIALTEGLTEEEARGLVADAVLSAAYIIPSGFHSAILSGTRTQVGLLGNVDAVTSTAVAEAIAAGFVERLRVAQLSVATLASLSGEPPDPALAEEAASFEPPIQVGTVEAATRQLDAATYYTAGMAVFFVFFTVAIGVTGLLDERREGTMARLLAAPVSRTSILAGKVITSVALGLTSMAVLVAASSLLIGAEWGDPLGAAALIVAVVLAAVGIMALVAGMANTPESAENIQSIIAVTLAALGGSFFQVSLAEGILSRVSALTPHYWFLAGLADLRGGAGLPDILPAVGAIAVFALVAGGAGWLLLRRKALT